MYKKLLLLLTTSIMFATFLMLACSLSTYKATHAMSASVAVQKQEKLVIPGSSVVPLDGMDVKALAAVTSRDIWIAGEYSNAPNQWQAFFEHFDGLQWQLVDPHVSGNFSNITSLAAISANDIWAVGSYADGSYTGGALIEHWNGSRWSLADIHPSENSNLASVIALSATDVWAVGASSLPPDYFHSSTLIKHFDGSRWHVVYSPSVGTKCSLSSITAISPNELWAVGSSYNVGTITEHYIGGNWSLVPDPSANSMQSEGASSLISTAALSAKDVWAVGATNSGRGGPLIEHWDNQSWSVVHAPALESEGTYQQLTSVLPLQSKNVWARGSYTDSSNGYHPLVTRWDGYEWDIIPMPDNLTQLNAWQQLGSSNVIIGIGTYDKQVRLLTIPAIAI